MLMLYDYVMPVPRRQAMRLSPSTDFTGKLDRAAVCLSGLCLLHCLALPLLLALFPLLGHVFMAHETFHQLILVVVLPTTTLALGSGYRRHRRRSVLALGVVGLAGLIVAAFTIHRLGAEEWERAATIAGGLVLAVAHGWNFRLTRAHRALQACHCTPQPTAETRQARRIAR